MYRHEDLKHAVLYDLLDKYNIIGKVLENRMLRKIFGPRKSGGNSIMRNFMICPVDCILL